MNPIARIEHVCARFVEGTFARIFPSALDPVQVGRKLTAMMHVSSGDLFLVRVHPADYARFAGDRDLIEARWDALLREASPAGRSGEMPRALLHEDARIVAGCVAIETVTEHRPVALALERPDGVRSSLRAGLRIGRNPDNDVVVRDARASRYHARISAHDGGFAIEDLTSTNGTFVDGERIPRAALGAGMLVTIGDTQLRICRDAG